jgi:hypothetical protein
MNFETSLQNKELPKIETFETSLSSEKDFEKLESQLQTFLGSEEAAQYVFVLKTITEENYANHCNNATQEFGKGLAKQFGGEESFFELSPESKFSDVRSYTPLNKMGYQGEFHSIGLLEFKNTEQKNSSLIIDLTYGTVSKNVKQEAILVKYISTTGEEVMNILHNHYGGSWKKDLDFNKESGKFVFKD